MFFEDLGFRYIGPVDGHNIRQLQKYLAMVREVRRARCCCTSSPKRGTASSRPPKIPTSFHAPAPFEREQRRGRRCSRSSSRRAVYATWSATRSWPQMRADPEVAVITAAMCQGNMLEPVRDEFPDRFFDVGICESHAVAFAAGLAKAGLRPIVDIYSTFLQRSYDQIFQEVALQNLPVTLLLDRAGLVGPDGPTHHGVFDLAYLRPLPEPGRDGARRCGRRGADARLGPAARRPDGHPLSQGRRRNRSTASRPPIELGKAEVLRWGRDGMIIACGTLLAACVEAADRLADEGLDVGVINARFVKPLDTETILRGGRRMRRWWSRSRKAC